jgi:cell division protein FtsW
MDVVLAAAAIALLGFGVVMVYSASIIEATTVFRNPQYFLIRQAIFAGIGLAIILTVSRIDVHRLKPFTYPILGLVTFLMVLSVVGFGHSGGGATRWLAVGPIHIQPSEMAKLALILWLAYSLEKKREKMKSFSIGMLPHFLMAGLLMLLCLKQPDFGSAVVLLFLTFALLFVAGARLGYLLGAALVGAMFAAWAVRFTSYRWVRIIAWSNMSDHRQDLAYQPFQSVMSFGSGEGTGLGLGKGLQVLYLPESHTDFISAIIGEELGFLGIVGLCAVFMLVVARGVRAALSSEDEYSSYIAFGISVLFGAQTLVNLAVSMAMLPTKGLTLPFISYGGSSLLVSCAAMGILLSISRRAGTPENARIDGPTPPPPEVSAMLVTEAGFAPEPGAFRGMNTRGAL